MDYRAEIYCELLKRIQKDGLTFELSPDNMEANLFMQNGQEVGKVTREGEIFIKLGQRDVMNSVSRLKDSVQEYVTAYYQAPPLVAADLPNGYKKLSDLGNYVFAAKQMANSSFEFVTWEYTYDRSGVGHGNYFYDYEAAKTDFGVRTGMIDRSKLFSEKEILFLYKHLSHYMDLNNYMSFDDEKDVKALLDKMKDIEPECHSEYLSSAEPDNDFDDERK